jgi:hypothetical protein
MQFKLSFSLLLASIVATSWSPNATLVEAAPVRGNPGMVSLPLKRVPAREGIHPLVVSTTPFLSLMLVFDLPIALQMFQQHLNRGHRRLARMTGSQEPTARELEDKLVKRIIAVGEAELVKRYNRENSLLQKRFNRQGTSLPEIPGLNELQGLKGLDSLNSLKGVLPNDVISSLTGNQDDTSTGSNG